MCLGIRLLIIKKKFLRIKVIGSQPNLKKEVSWFLKNKLFICHFKKNLPITKIIK